MKRKMFFIICLLVMSLTTQAQQNVISTQIHLRVSYFDPIGTTNQDPRSPLDPPTVYIEDYTLTFEADHQEFVLYIKDETQSVIYTTVVSETDTEVVLPSTLSGTYEIDLVTDDYYFWGYIDL